MKKKIVISFIALSIPFIASAATPSLLIMNNTKQDSTSILNRGPCSTILGKDVGITRAGKPNNVPGSALDAGCKLNKKSCLAEVHMTDNCTGPVIARVYLDITVDPKTHTQTGIYNITPVDTSQGYVVSGKGFSASLDGGPSLSIKDWFKRKFGF